MDNLPDGCTLADIDDRFGEQIPDAKCYECSGDYFSDDLHNVAGDLICDECVERLHLRCDHCGEISAVACEQHGRYNICASCTKEDNRHGNI